MMMSDPRRFVLTGALAADQAADPLTEILAVLGRAFTVTRETGAPASAAEGRGARRRTWLDTFDWRLFNAGLLLEHEHARRGGHGGRIILSAADGSLRAEQPAAPSARYPTCLRSSARFGHKCCTKSLPRQTSNKLSPTPERFPDMVALPKVHSPCNPY